MALARARRLQGEAARQLQGVTAEGPAAALTRPDRLALASLACIVLALARPQWDPRPYDVDRRGRDLVIVLDVSRSMLAADLFPSRLEMARIAILEALPALGGQRVALVTFAGSASVRVPLTQDHGFVRYLLDRADPSDLDVGSTSLQAAVDKVVDTVLTDAAPGGCDVIMFTDGEDHLGDVRQTADRLAQSGARVLVIGLGDPVQGARVPDPLDESRWLQHNDTDVVTRLEERTLQELARRAPNVTYYPARTQPFDLVPLYQQLIAGATEDVPVAPLRRVRYSQAYPYLLALAVALWLGARSRRRGTAKSLALLILLLPGCAAREDQQAELTYRARCKQGSELLKSAEEQAETDVFAARSLLDDAREQYLRAALLKPGDRAAARQVTHITRRLRVVDTEVERQRAAQRRRREKLSDLIQQLEELTGHQVRLSERSRQLMRQRPPPSEEDYNLPEEMAVGSQGPTRQQARQAPAIAKEQQTVRTGTASVLEQLRAQQATLRELLTRAYGNTSNLPPTEVDPIVELLAGAVTQQEQALVSLTAQVVRWPQANTALHTASGRLQQSLEALRGLQPPETGEEEDTNASRSCAESSDSEALESETRDGQAQPPSPGDFQAALALDALPIPNYSAAEILAEEAANQQKRARRKAASAGARVEKNW